MEPQSRWMMRTFFRRNFDSFVDSAKARINWIVLGADLLVIYLLFRLL